MRKSKKLFLSILALNSVFTNVALGNSAAGSPKYNGIYNNMIKNINQGKSNKKNYEVIEKILKQRNKELGELYLQSDYTVKPEFLEWQIFATGFYSERKNEDNTSENAKYKSGISGYYDKNGSFIAGTSGMKPYKPEQEVKTIDLGMSIPVREISRSSFDLQVDLDMNEPQIPAVPAGMTLETLNIVNLDLVDFTPNIPVISGAALPNVVITVTNLKSYDSYGGDTLLGAFVNVPAGVYHLSDVEGLPSLTGYTPTRDNAIVDFGYIRYSGAPYYSSDAGAEMHVDVERRRGVGLDASYSLTFENKGKIYLDANETAGLEIQTGFSNFMEVENSGLITGDKLNQAAMIYTVEDGGTITGNHVGSFINSGTIDLKGDNSTGINLNGGKLTINPGTTQTLKAVNTGEIKLSGYKNYGLVLNTGSVVASDSVMLNDTTGLMTLSGDESGGIVVLSDLNSQILNKGTININSDKSYGLYSKVSSEFKNSGTIALTGSEKSTGLMSIGGHLSNISGGIISINGGLENTGMFASSGKVDNSGTLTISGGSGNIGAMLDGSASAGKNTGNMLINGDDAKGVIVTGGATFENTNVLKVEGENAYGLVSQGGTIKGGAADIDISGTDSIGVYAGGTSATSSVELNSGIVKVSDGGVNFGAGQNGTLTLNSVNFTVGSGSLGFYTQANGQINIQNSVGTIEGGSGVSDRGTVFSIKGNGIGATDINTVTDLITLMGVSGINPVNLTLNMNSGSRLFSLEDASVNLSVVETLNSSSIPLTGVTINGTDYKTMLLNKGLLKIDEVSDLDDPDSGYARMEISGSSITNESIIKGLGNSQLGMAQANISGITKSTVTLTNNGSINLAGDESVGIYADYGIIENNSIIETSGKDSYGIFGVNGTEVSTAAASEIKAGSGGAGVVLQSYTIDPVTNLPVTTSGYGDGSFKLDHNGVISLTGEKMFGVYADNNDPAVIPVVGTRIVNLNAGSMIDLSSTTASGTGVYANKITLNTSGDLKIGSTGAGIYSKDSDVNVNGGTVELSGDDSTAFLLYGNSNLTASTGTINVTGNNNTIFVIDTLAATSGAENINININPGLKLTLANVKNNTFIYDGIINGLGEESVLIYGDNSEIGLWTNAKITSAASKVTGLAASGQKALNKGELLLSGDNSAGIYTNGAVAENEGKIILGTKGIGIYNKNSQAYNISGEIRTGEGGVGIFGTDSVSITNNALIDSTEKSVTGIYSKGDSTGTLVENGITGNISLAGDNSIGIYTAGTLAKNIINNGIISIGNSSDINNPSVGIYSSTAGSSVTNNSIITAGDNSVGLYNKGGTVLHTGSIVTGNAGTGIYSSGGTVNIGSSSAITAGSNEAAAVYGTNSAGIINDSSNITLGNKSIGFVLESGATLLNNGSVVLGDENILVYGDNAGSITSSNLSSIAATGSNNIVFYTVNGGNIINDSTITANNGSGNIGIYNSGGSIENHGNISLGNSQIVTVGGIVDTENSRYSVGIYGENSKVANTGNIDLGENAVGIYVKDNLVTAKNSGIITAGSMADPKKGAIGIFAEGGAGFENFGDITLYGQDVIGIAGKNSGKIINHAVISVTGDNSVGIYATLNTEVENLGTINVSGNNGIGIIAPDGKILNKGTINISNGASNTKTEEGYDTPELINAGIINVNGHFSNEGMTISLKPDLDTLHGSTVPGVDFVLSSGTISANSMYITDTVKILADFSQGTNAKVYKLEDVFMTSNGSITSANGKIPVVSNSLTWVATPSVNSAGNVDIYMEKLDYHEFTSGLWFDDFGKALDEKYAGASGDGGKISDQIDLLENEKDFRHVMASLAGNVYANINQREDDIARAFENSMDMLQGSENNTKENIKVSVIAGKGKTTEDTDGITGYDYTTTGILALREVERTYRHTFGYSLGYLHTGFEFNDGNQSEESADTVQLGVHNKYKANGWKLINNLTGRVSIHNIDRNIDWPDPTGRSEMNGTYETYSITSDNILGKEFFVGKRASVTPYGAFRVMYAARPDFTENGLEALEVEGNDAWSVKPRAGMQLNGTLPLGSTSGWQVKGTLDFAYEYELADLNERESARLTAIEDSYHKLSKPQDEKGTFKTKALLGVEIIDRYGIFLTGEYSIGNAKEDDYRAGVSLKAVF